MATRTSMKASAPAKPAKSDIFAGLLSENHDTANLGVLLNDLGSSTLYSLSQNPPAIHTGTPMQAADDERQKPVHLDSGAVIKINSDGTVNYDGRSWSGAFLTRIQSMHAGQRITDTFDYTIRTANGDLSTAHATVHIEGRNDAATISGTSTDTVTEDNVLSAAGTLIVNDVDSGDREFQTPARPDGIYGHFSLNASSGAWGYTLNNDAANVQALTAGQTVVDELTVTSKDGSASQTISVRIHGVDEPEVINTGGTGGTGGAGGTGGIGEAGGNAVAGTIGGTSTGAVAEDGPLTADGLLTITGNARFQPAPILMGNYGDFTFDANTGSWDYALRNDAVNVQALAQGEQRLDPMVVQSLNGSSMLRIIVTVSGANDTPTLDPLRALDIVDTSADDGAAAADDVAIGHDVDANTTLHYAVANRFSPEKAFNSHFHPRTAPGDGFLQQAAFWGTLSINDGTGAYTFIADATTIDQLQEDEQVTLSYTITVSDGIADDVTQALTVVLTGINDPAEITGNATGSVTEGDQLPAVGKLTVSDRDHDQNIVASDTMLINGDNAAVSFSDTLQPAVGAVKGLYGTFTVDTVSGDWGYALGLDDDSIQALALALTANDPPTETLGISSLDHTATQAIVVTIAPIPVIVVGSMT